MTTMLGFAALSVDIGYLYMVKAELQVSADAAALAAAGQLATIEDSRFELARQMAVDYAAKNLVANQTMYLDPEVDVVFGQAVLDTQSNRYVFAAGVQPIDAVRVRVRKTSDSPNGAVALFFANIFGRSEKDMFAEATAILVPRDIAIVADLSASHTDDSELCRINDTTVNLYDVWAAMPGGMDEGDPNWSPQKAGPTWGTWMEQAGFGEMTLDSSYDPTTDSGLLYLPRYNTWNNAALTAMLQAQNYNADEIAAIMSSANDSDSTVWKARACVALGLAVWRSGMGVDSSGQPGKWQAEGLAAGNGNSYVSWSSELTWVESYPYPGGSWSEYCDYMKNSTAMTSQGNSNFKYRFGAKTFMNYLLENRRCYNECPDLRFTPTQPMQAVKDSVTRMMQIIEGLDTDDQVSLEIYAQTARHEVDLTFEYADVSNRLNDMQAGHYDCWTNMGGGIQRGIEELTSDRARHSATKVMILLTDGWANVTEWGSVGDYTNGPIYAVEAARDAAALGIRIYAVSVGSSADTNTMEQIAQIGKGTHFYAQGSIEDYSAQLQAIFETLGGKRPVMLID
ncbi:MAG: VWA domain-containing protein [Phycisphaerae bacterium]|nr:VWA domain-containing protein [Phycisphaerae bacterium]